MQHRNPDARPVALTTLGLLAVLLVLGVVFVQARVAVVVVVLVVAVGVLRYLPAWTARVEGGDGGAGGSVTFRWPLRRVRVGPDTLLQARMVAGPGSSRVLRLRCRRALRFTLLTWRWHGAEALAGALLDVVDAAPDADVDDAARAHLHAVARRP